MNSQQQIPICMEEEFWMNSHFSLARHYGGIRVFNHEYYIVGSDLVREDFRQLYKKLGRDRFISILKESGRLPDAQIKQLMKEAVNVNKKTNVSSQHPSLFE